jgi:hypothetical protein
MRPIRWQGKLSNGLAILVLFQLSVATTNADPSVFVRADRQLEDELRFRRDFGFDLDPAAVAELMAAPTNYIGDYGLALTPSEPAELQARLVREDQMVAVRDHAERQPSFAGAWIDQPGGGIIKVAFAGDAEAHRADIQARAPGSPVEVLDVDYSWTNLEAVLTEVETLRIGLKEQGTDSRTGNRPSPQPG